MSFNPHRNGTGLMYRTVLFVFLVLAASSVAAQSTSGLASWYGESHRGKLMANGEPFDPEKMTAASWFYPLGTIVRVSTTAPDGESRAIFVVITDRGPARKHVQKGRIIDLARAGFKRLADLDVGLVAVSVERVP